MKLFRLVTLLFVEGEVKGKGLAAKLICDVYRTHKEGLGKEKLRGRMVDHSIST